MKIILSQTDLDSAVRTYVESLGMNLIGKSVDVDFTAGRGANGNTATVEILPEKYVDNVKEAPVALEAKTQPVEPEPNDSENLFDND